MDIIKQLSGDTSKRNFVNVGFQGSITESRHIILDLKTFAGKQFVCLFTCLDVKQVLRNEVTAMVSKPAYRFALTVLSVRPRMRIAHPVCFLCVCFFASGVNIGGPVSPLLRFYSIFHCSIHFTLEWSPILLLTMAQVC